MATMTAKKAQAKKASKKTSTKKATVKMPAIVQYSDNIDDENEGTHNDAGMFNSKLYQSFVAGKPRDDRSCQDMLSDAMKLATHDADKKTDIRSLAAVAGENGLDLNARWGKLNPGQQRMNLGNCLRNHLNRGGIVYVASKAFCNDKKGELSNVTVKAFYDARDAKVVKAAAKKAAGRKAEAVKIAAKGRQPKTDNAAYIKWLGAKKDNKASRTEYNEVIAA